MPCSTARAAARYAAAASRVQRGDGLVLRLAAATRPATRSVERVQGAVEGLPYDDAARPGVAGQGGEPGAQARDVRSGSRPAASRAASGMPKSGAAARPCSRSIEARWLRMSAIASGGTRSRTIATAVPRSAAWRSRSHGTASA